MKCVQIKGPKQVGLGEIEEPTSKNGSVVIDVLKCGICGSDIHYYDIGQPEGLVMGHEFVGTVIDPGSRKDLKVGDRVTGLPISPCGKCEACKSGNPQYCPVTWNEAVGLSLTNPGAYAEKTSVRPDLIIKVPDNVSDAEAAMVEPTAVGYHAVNLVRFKGDENVLVVGAGIIGQITALLAKKAGAGYVAIAETNELRGKKAVEHGVADEFFNAKDEKFLENVKAHNPYGFDIVFDCCGNSTAVTNEILSVKPGGRIVLVGVSLDAITIPSALVVTKELKMFGAIAYTVDEFEKCLNMMAKGELNMIDFVDDIVPLEDAQEAFNRLTAGDDAAVKILFDPKM